MYQKQNLWDLIVNAVGKGEEDKKKAEASGLGVWENGSAANRLGNSGREVGLGRQMA